MIQCDLWLHSHIYRLRWKKRKKNVGEAWKILSINLKHYTNSNLLRLIPNSYLMVAVWDQRSLWTRLMPVSTEHNNSVIPLFRNNRQSWWSCNSIINPMSPVEAANLQRHPYMQCTDAQTPPKHTPLQPEHLFLATRLYSAVWFH